MIPEHAGTEDVTPLVTGEISAYADIAFTIEYTGKQEVMIPE